MKILYLGDICGRPGRTQVRQQVKLLRERLGLDLLLANGENASGGLGLSAKNARELLASGIDALSSGNHIWKFKDIGTFMKDEPRLIRPENYPPGAPGKGWAVYHPENTAPFALINLQGRTFMPEIDCPFQAVDRILAMLDEKHPDVLVRIVDFHAEATSEKISMGWHLDGRVSALVGTHTHVQTSDTRVLPEGTAYLTDLGMCGPRDSCLGMKYQPIVRKFLTSLPVRFEVAGGPVVLQGAVIDVDESTGKARYIELFNE